MEWILLKITFCIAGALMIWADIWSHRMSAAARSWPNVEGSILSARIVTDHFASCVTPSIKYSYSVHSVRHVSSQFSYSSDLATLSEANQLIANYPTGTKVIVYYDPLNPRTAVIKQADPSDRWSFVFFGACFFAFGAFVQA